MTRRQIEQDYDVIRGVIRSPGKFEGERVYVPHFWDDYLNGPDTDDGLTLGYRVTNADRKEFPELRRKRWVRLIQNDQGFVREV